MKLKVKIGVIGIISFSCLIAVIIVLFGALNFTSKEASKSVKISVIQESVEVEIGNKINLPVSIYPEEARVNISSYDPSVINFENGMLVAKSFGHTDVSISANFENSFASAKLEIIVIPSEDSKLKLVLSGEELLKVGSQIPFKTYIDGYYIEPEKLVFSLSANIKIKLLFDSAYFIIIGQGEGYVKISYQNLTCLWVFSTI